MRMLFVLCLLLCCCRGYGGAVENIVQQFQKHSLEGIALTAEEDTLLFQSQELGIPLWWAKRVVALSDSKIEAFPDSCIYTFSLPPSETRYFLFAYQSPSNLTLCTECEGKLIKWDYKTTDDVAEGWLYGFTLATIQRINDGLLLTGTSRYSPEPHTLSLHIHPESKTWTVTQ